MAPHRDDPVFHGVLLRKPRVRRMARVAFRRGAMERFVGGCRALSDRRAESLLKRIHWCKTQLDFLRCDAQEKAIILGNQLGKTTVALADLIYCCTGEHPYRRVRAAPIVAWVVCATHETSIVIQTKLWELVPKELLAGSTVFKPGEGFRGKHPKVVFRNGSMIRFKTTAQGGLRLASDTLDYVLIDELTSRRIYTELLKRTMRKGGTVATSATPVNMPSEYLRERCESGECAYFHTRMTPEAFIPVGDTKPISFVNAEGANVVCDATWVAREIARTPEAEREVACHGEWPSGDADRELAGFSTANLFGKNQTTQRTGQIECYALGLDHGEKAGREVVTLCGWDSRGIVWVLGVYCSTGKSSLDDDAVGVQALLREWGLKLGDVAFAVGDINSAGAAHRGMTVNQYMEGVFTALNGGHRPFPIRGATKGAGSVDDRTILLNHALAGRKLMVHEGAAPLLKSIKFWRGQNNRLKDPIDSLGYVYAELAPLRSRKAQASQRVR